MKFRRLSHRALFGGAAAGVAALSAIQPAYADRAVDLTFRETPGYARIVARWSDGDQQAPRVSAVVSNQVLVLRFDQKVTANLKALEAGLPNWAAVTRMDADGMTIRIGLRQAPRVEVSTSVDLTAIDLVPEAASGRPPPLVSPLVAKLKAEAAAELAASLPKPAAIEPLEVRASHAGENTRIAFYWPNPVSYRVVKEAPGSLQLLFSRRAEVDLAYMRISPPENLADFQTENTDRGFLVTLTSRDGMPMRHMSDDGVAIVDISPPPKPAPDPDPAKIAEAPKPALPRLSTAPQTPKPQARSITAAALDADRPVLLAPPMTLLQPDVEGDADAADAAPQGVILGGKDRTTVLAAGWKDPSPPNGVVEIGLRELASGIELEAPFAAPAAGAVFARGNAVWVVFAANADLKLDPASMPSGYRVRTLRGPNATMMRIEAPRAFTVSAEQEDATWRIRIAPSANRPKSFLKPERKPGPRGKPQIETVLPSVAGLVWFEDPAIGDMIAAAVAYGPSAASPTSQEFVEAALPATAHGLAIVPRSDGVSVTLEQDKVVVAMAGVTARPGAKDSVQKPEAPPENVAFVDFAKWGGLSGRDYFRRLGKLEDAASAADLQTPESTVALMELARFYLGHDLALEALGVLRVAAVARPEVESDVRFLGLRGAANAMAYRFEDAEADLSKGQLRDDASVSLWRAVAAARQGLWERASDHMRLAGNQVHAYTPDKAAHFAVTLAEAALHTNDFETARRQAELAKSTGVGEDVHRAEYILAALSQVIEGPLAAYPEYTRLAESAEEPVAVRAELKRLEAGVASGQMTANDAAAELESLRFRWRGDGVEMATVGILADQYMRVGRFREALLLAQSTALRDAGAPGARDLRIKLTDYFRRLYLEGEADRLDPIQALALFYEFADSLTPIGNDGDAMIRKLSQRLIAFDLLEPAAQLLQHQVDNRMRGVAKAALAVDLAMIYLRDRKPDRALVAINTTRQPQLPRELSLERRLIEAAAYRDIGRFDHVIELVQELDGKDAKSLLADAYWRSRNWGQSARAYLSMLPPPGEASPADASIAFRAAVAGRLARDMALLGEVRRYAPIMETDANRASFDVIVAQADLDGAAVSEAVRRIGDAPRIDAFAAYMADRLRGVAPSPATQPAAPAESAAPPAGETANQATPATGAG